MHKEMMEAGVCYKKRLEYGQYCVTTIINPSQQNRGDNVRVDK